MKMRLIDADELIKVADHAYSEWNLAMAAADTNRQVNLTHKMQDLCKAVRAVAKAAPTIDPESLRPQGEWIKIELDWHELWQCSHCKEEWDFAYDPTAEETVVKYCPDCGAKMKKDGDSE